jgi:hypothetical protein
MKSFAAAPLLALFALAACSAGAGSVGVDPMGNREDPGQRRDTPNDTRESSPASRDGTGGERAGGGACVACDGNYECNGVTDMQNVSIVLALKTVNGQCTAGDSVLACGGAILDKGKPSGSSWTHQGSGFVVHGPKGESFACTPTNKPPTKTGTTITNG